MCRCRLHTQIIILARSFQDGKLRVVALVVVGLMRRSGLNKGACDISGTQPASHSFIQIMRVRNVINGKHVTACRYCYGNWVFKWWWRWLTITDGVPCILNWIVLRHSRVIPEYSGVCTDKLWHTNFNAFEWTVMFKINFWVL